MKHALHFLSGLLFAAGLVISGMANPHQVVAFLDVAGGKWDPSLAFVMVGAIGSFALLNLLIHRRETPVFEGKLPGRRSDTGVSPRLLGGAALFGLGWGLSGVCPGPALTDVSTLRPEVFAYLGTMLVGMVIAQRGFGMDEPKTPAEPEAKPETEPAASPS